MNVHAFIVFLLFCLTFVEGYVSLGRRKCPNLTIKNAKVRPRNRGRLGRVVCLASYRLLGDKFVYCEEGEWARPLPSCIKSGCPEIDKLIPNSRVEESYSGALVEVSCADGFTMVGQPFLSCDGVFWNDTIPSCYLNKEHMYKLCDLESEDMCGWVNDLSDNFDWKRHSMATPSGHAGTGPEFDHTHGSGVNGNYLYIEASNRNVGDVARLKSPRYRSISGNETVCFSFWYHMYGGHIGSLNVFVGNNLLFNKSGNNGNRWLKAVLPINSTSSPFRITIEGIRGNGYAGDIAIDDLKLSKGSDCLQEKNETEITLSGSCLGRCYDNITEVNITEISSCYCHDACHVNNSCCDDFFQVCGLAKSSTPGTELKTVSQDNSTTLTPFQPNTSLSVSSITPTTVTPTTNSLTFKTDTFSPIQSTSTPVNTTTYFLNNFTTSIQHQHLKTDYFNNEKFNRTFSGNNFTTSLTYTTLNSTTPPSPDNHTSITTPISMNRYPTITYNTSITKQPFFNYNKSYSENNINLLTVSINPVTENLLHNINNITVENVSKQSFTTTIQPLTTIDTNLNFITMNYSSNLHDTFNNLINVTSKPFVAVNNNKTIIDSNKNSSFVTTTVFQDFPQINTNSSADISRTNNFLETTPVNRFVNNTTQFINQDVSTGNNINLLSTSEFQTNSTPKTIDKIIKNISLVPSVNINNTVHNDKFILYTTTRKPFHFINTTLFSQITTAVNNNFINTYNISQNKTFPFLEFITPEPPVFYRTPVFPIKSNITGQKQSNFSDIFKFNNADGNKTTIINFNVSTISPLLKITNNDGMSNKTIKPVVLTKSFVNTSTVVFNINNQTSTLFPPKQSEVQITSIGTTKSNSISNDVLFTRSYNTTVRFYQKINTSTVEPITVLPSNKTVNIEKKTEISKQNKNITYKWDLVTSGPKIFNNSILTTSTKSVMIYDPKSKTINNHLNIIPINRPIKTNIPTKVLNKSSISKPVFEKFNNTTRLNPATTQTPMKMNTKSTTAKNKMKQNYVNYWNLNMSSVEYASKWRLKYINKGNQAKFTREGTSIISPSTVIGVILAILTLSVFVIAVGCLIRRRRINRNADNDESDVQFLTSDEILNFNWARPSPDRQDRHQPAPKPPKPQKCVPQDCIRLVDQ